MISNQADPGIVPRWRTRCAIALAVGFGFPVGLFLRATAVPFGPILLGWIAAFVGAVIVTASLCVLATDRLHLVGLGYAAGVALAVVVASIAVNGISTELFISFAQFVVVFAVVLIPAGLTSSLCSLLKREDKRARERNCQQ